MPHDILKTSLLPGDMIIERVPGRPGNEIFRGNNYVVVANDPTRRTITWFIYSPLSQFGDVTVYTTSYRTDESVDVSDWRLIRPPKTQTRRRGHKAINTGNESRCAGVEGDKNVS